MSISLCLCMCINAGIGFLCVVYVFFVRVFEQYCFLASGVMPHFFILLVTSSRSTLFTLIFSGNAVPSISLFISSASASTFSPPGQQTQRQDRIV